MVGLEPRITAVRGQESNGMAESFVKTMRRDYTRIMPKPDGWAEARYLAETFERYNEWHPHSALGYCPLREYKRNRTSNGLRCMEIRGKSILDLDWHILCPWKFHTWGQSQGIK